MQPQGQDLRGKKARKSTGAGTERAARRQAGTKAGQANQPLAQELKGAAQRAGKRQAGNESKQANLAGTKGAWCGEGTMQGAGAGTTAEGGTNQPTPGTRAQGSGTAGRRQ
jgi:hypothetical protein